MRKAPLVVLIIIVTVSIVLMFVILNFDTVSKLFKKSSSLPNSKDTQELQKEVEDAQKIVKEDQAKKEKAYEDVYNKTKGITSGSEFDQRFAQHERERASTILLKRLVIDDKQYDIALQIANYFETSSYKTSNTIDFNIFAYRAANNAKDTNLMAKYKKKVEDILVDQGVTKQGTTVTEDYLMGTGGQSEKPNE